MSEKRFKIHPECKRWIYDFKTKNIYTSIDTNSLCDLLNEFENNNQELLKENHEIKDIFKNIVYMTEGNITSQIFTVNLAISPKMYNKINKYMSGDLHY